MTKPKWYSPQLARELVSKLYFRAKLEGIPMTTLVNRIVQTALDKEQVVECQRDTDSAIAAVGRTRSIN
jgi:hypothetical protein